MSGFADPITARIADFLNEIGIAVRAGTVNEPTALPGLRIDQAAIIVDEARLGHPGDLLHEAGHLAVAPPARRDSFHHDVGNDAAEEMMAIAWSYAAALHLKIDPALVFHEDGYRGGSAGILESFGDGRFFGAPMLDYAGMTYHGPRPLPRDAKPFPHMIRWLRPA